MAYELTDEGRRYLRSGLPELRLVRILEKRGGVSLDELRSLLPELAIALAWAKRNGWVEVRGKIVRLLKVPRKYELQLALRSIEEGREVEADLLNLLLKRKLVQEVKRSVRDLAEEQLRAGINRLTPELLRSGLWRKAKLKPYDVRVIGSKRYPGKYHPYRRILDEVRERLIAMGFVEAKGPLVELNFWNCDALFMPSDHPARSIHDMFFVEYPREGKVLDKNLWKRVELTHRNGWKTGSCGWGNWDFSLARRLILRSHCTAVSARKLAELGKTGEIPHKMFVIDRVFRPDVIDAKHFIEFEQCEGIVVGEGLNFRHLLGYLSEIARFFGAERIRFKPSYFPFTEPSVEGFAYHEKLGWVEFAGAGIFRPEVTLPLGVSCPVLAWGLGIGRLALLRLGVDDIRYLYSTDLDWLRKKSVI